MYILFLVPDWNVDILLIHSKTNKFSQLAYDMLVCCFSWFLFNGGLFWLLYSSFLCNTHNHQKLSFPGWLHDMRLQFPTTFLILFVLMWTAKPSLKRSAFLYTFLGSQHVLLGKCSMYLVVFTFWYKWHPFNTSAQKLIFIIVALVNWLG